MKRARSKKQPEATRRKLIEATVALMLKRGFNATTVDEICAEADVTKGGFFHHFKNKDDIGQAVLKAWGEFGQSIYAEAWKQPGEPLEEIHRLFDIMDGITRRPEPCVCLVGMLTQELSGEHPGFRAACARELDTWTEMFRSRLEAAKSQLKPASNFDPAEVAWFLNSLWQGSALAGKARQSTKMIRANVRLARAYVDSLFASPPKPFSQSKKTNKTQPKWKKHVP
jgi:TetR/AcrR family transcriptional regulator, transcriptional repressor for nem operon